MMIGRTEVLAVGSIKFISERNLLPASELAYCSLLTTVTMKLDIKQLGSFQLVGYKIVHTINSQFNIHTLHHVVTAIKHGYCCDFLRLLYRQ